MFLDVNSGQTVRQRPYPGKTKPKYNSNNSIGCWLTSTEINQSCLCAKFMYCMINVTVVSHDYGNCCIA